MVSTRDVTTGLGIHVSGALPPTTRTALPSNPHNHPSFKTSSQRRRPPNGSTDISASSRVKCLGTISISHTQPPPPQMQSSNAMNGLLLAETGGAMVEFDHNGEFRVGQRIAPETMTPVSGTKRLPPVPPRSSLRGSSVDSLSQHSSPTLNDVDSVLNVCATPRRTATELKSFLGNSSSKLRPNATVVPRPQSSFRPPGSRVDSYIDTSPVPVTLEQSKTNARVEVDITLESDTCVQGGFLKGYIRLNVKALKKEPAVLIGQGKLRIVGFECIPYEDSRCIFYQCSAPLSGVTPHLKGVFETEPDDEGWAEAKDGMHIIPFAMRLPMDGEGGHGTAKGTISVHSGVSVRYVAMISIKVKDSNTLKQSIAHFYRDCEIWPQFDIHEILAPSARPLVIGTSKNIFMGGSGKLQLTAHLHRPCWIAGQRCTINIRVVNDTKKTVKSATLSLLRTTTIFKPHAYLDAGGEDSWGAKIADPDACQTSTMTKQVAESSLEMAQRTTKGHASAKGWWSGVNPGQTVEFSHSILLPPDALSVSRVRFLEVEYTLRVCLNAGGIRSEVHVIVPVRIVNFISLDPPPLPLNFMDQPAIHRQGSSGHDSWYRKSRMSIATSHTGDSASTLRYGDYGTEPLSPVDEMDSNDAADAESISIYPPTEADPLTTPTPQRYHQSDDVAPILEEPEGPFIPGPDDFFSDTSSTDSRSLYEGSDDGTVSEGHNASMDEINEVLGKPRSRDGSSGGSTSTLVGRNDSPENVSPRVAAEKDERGEKTLRPKSLSTSQPDLPSVSFAQRVHDKLQVAIAEEYGKSTIRVKTADDDSLNKRRSISAFGSVSSRSLPRPPSMVVWQEPEAWKAPKALNDNVSGSLQPHTTIPLSRLPSVRISALRVQKGKEGVTGRRQSLPAQKAAIAARNRVQLSQPW